MPTIILLVQINLYARDHYSQANQALAATPERLYKRQSGEGTMP
jgi:hypothetical protein